MDVIAFLKLDKDTIPLERLVEEEAKRRNLTPTPMDFVAIDLKAPVIFYRPSEKQSELESKLTLQGIREKNPRASIIFMGEGEPLDENVYLLNAHSTPQDVSVVFEMIYNTLRPRPHVLLVSGGTNQRLRGALLETTMNQIPKEDAELSELEQYKNHNAPFNFVVLEGSTNIRRLTLSASELFPDAQIIAVGDIEDRRKAINGGAHFYTYDNIESLKLFMRAMPAMTQPFTGKEGKVYLFAGTYGAGKTEAAEGIIAAFPDLIAIQKDTTRKNRPGEAESRIRHVDAAAFEKNRRAGKYLFSYSHNEQFYGIPKHPFEQLRMGRDLILTVTEPSRLPQIIEEVNSRFKGAATPILFYAQPATLRQRLQNREASEQEREERAKIQVDLLKQFWGMRETVFKYAINTGTANVMDTQRILKGIIQWERDFSGKDYVTQVMEYILPPDFLQRAFDRRAHELKLVFPTRVLDEYGTEHQLPKDKLYNIFEKIDIAATSLFDGRLGIWIPYWKMKRFDARETVLDLIQRSIPLEMHSRSKSKTHLNISLYGRCESGSSKFNNGLLYQLGDSFVEHATKARPVGITFGFVQKPRAMPYDINAITPDRKQAYTDLAREMLEDPLFIPNIQ